MTIEKVEVPRKIRSIAVIGGGASGAVTLDTLKKERAFDKITVFERRDRFGGVWILDEDPVRQTIVPGMSFKTLDKQIDTPQFDGDEILLPSKNQHRFLHTPAYHNIRTNVPERFMTYSDNPHWPVLDKPELDTLTTRNHVQSYIEEYFDRYKDSWHLRTTVEVVTKLENGQYELLLRTETDEIDETGVLKLDRWWRSTFDAVVIAVGHYHVPFIPEVEGIEKVIAKFPHAIEHAKWFRDPKSYANQTVIVIGSRASGWDLSRLISKYSKEIYLSRRTTYKNLKLDIDALVKEVKPTIVKYELTDNGFNAVFDDGSVIENPDKIIYGTGYQFSYPFLNRLYPDFSNGYILPTSYQHTFYQHDPLITTIGVPVDGLSFRVFEYQAILVSRFLSGKVALPPTEEQDKWRAARFEKFGNARAYHTIGFEGAVEYLKELTELGGGVSKLGVNGKDFPVIETQDVEWLVAERDRLKKHWDERVANEGIDILRE